MRASLDTNAIIHFYRAGLQNILFDFFTEGVFIYEQIRNIELENHGRDILDKVDTDIEAGKIEKYTDEKLKAQHVFNIFAGNVKENRLLYGAGDMGEVYAIALAQTIGSYSLVTDDIKQGGPYMSLLQFEDEIMPFTFADILILRYLFGKADVQQTIRDFDAINMVSELNWVLRSQVAKFIRRFWKEPYRQKDLDWMEKRVKENRIAVKTKFVELQQLI